MKYTINELANSKGVSQPVREALLQMEAELDATNRQVEILSDALAESRREVAALKAVQSAERGEPVAWMHTMIDDVVVGHRPADLNVHPDRWMPLYKDPTPCQTCQALARTVMMDQTAHDIPPAAQRQWVGLTDEDLRAATRLESTKSHAELDLGKAFWSGARWAEAKLKEKNNG